MAKLKGTNYALLEVSSHSIVQKRIKNLAFNVFCFTNLSQDHLDYHKDMETYFHAKLSILDMLRLDTNIIVNIDDEYGKIFLAKAKDKRTKRAILQRWNKNPIKIQGGKKLKFDELKEAYEKWKKDLGSDNNNKKPTRKLKNIIKFNFYYQLIYFYESMASLLEDAPQLVL